MTLITADELENVEVKSRRKNHGMYGTQFYRKFHGIRQHCEYKKQRDFKNYGGRGIKSLWNSFEEFKRDMYATYLIHIELHGQKDTTIERIDVNGNYCKENCRWATRLEQARNKRRSRFIEFNGKRQTVSTWAKELQLCYGTVLNRLERGWSDEKALSKQKHNRFGKLLVFSFQGQTLSLCEWSKRLGIKYPTLYRRIVLKGKPVEEAFIKS